MKKYLKTIGIFPLMTLTLCGFTPSFINLGPTTCYYFTNNDREMIYKPSESCKGTVVLYGSQPDILPNSCTSCNAVLIHCSDDTLPALSRHFSDEELQDIIDKKRFKRSLINKQEVTECTLRLPAFSPTSDEGSAVISQLFTPTPEYIIMHHPITGMEVYLYKIDYIKFKGISLIPLPPLS